MHRQATQVRMAFQRMPARFERLANPRDGVVVEAGEILRLELIVERDIDHGRRNLDAGQVEQERQLFAT